MRFTLIAVFLLTLPSVFAESIETILYLFIILVLLLIAAAVAYLVYIYYKQQKNAREKYDKLKKYVQQLLRQGQNPKTIKQTLINYGWEEELLTQVLSDIHTTFKNTSSKPPRYAYSNR